MTQIMLDALDNSAGWSSLQPDGVTPSTLLTLAVDMVRFWSGAGTASLRLTASGAFMGHRIQRTVASVDLSPFDELSLWWISSRVADGSPNHPFFLEMRLGSAAMPIDAVGNTWRRFLPLSKADDWELVHLALDDLPAGVRGALATIQIRCMDASSGFTANFDNLIAVRDQMLTDLDTAILERLHNRVTVGGTLIPAIFYHPEAPTAQPLPFIQIRQYHLTQARERTANGAAHRSDFTSTGFRLRRPGIPYDIFYLIDGFAATRAEKTQILEFVLSTLASGAYLTVNNRLHAVEWVEHSPFEPGGALHSTSATLCFKVSTRQASITPVPVKPVTTLLITAEHQ